MTDKDNATENTESVSQQPSATHATRKNYVRGKATNIPDFKHDGMPTYWCRPLSPAVWKVIAVNRLDQYGKDIVVATRVDGAAQDTCMMYADLFLDCYTQLDTGPSNMPPIFLTKREKWLMEKAYYEGHQTFSPLAQEAHSKAVITSLFKDMLGRRAEPNGLDMEARLATSAPKDGDSRITPSTTLPLPEKKQSIAEAKKFSRYFRDVSMYQEIDVYRVLQLFEVTSQPVGHAIKKLLAPGRRGGKTYRQDIEEAVAALQRELDMLTEDIKEEDHS